MVSRQPTSASCTAAHAVQRWEWCGSDRDAVRVVAGAGSAPWATGAGTWAAATGRGGLLEAGFADGDAEAARGEVEPARPGAVEHFGDAVEDAAVAAAEHEQVAGAELDIGEW